MRSWPLTEAGGIAITSSTEEWRGILGYEGVYEVSSTGRVRRVAAGQGARVGIRKQTAHPNGYMQVTLSRGNVQRTHKVHRLVLEAFVGPCPEGMEACHANDIPGDNRIENLHWGTHEENCAERSTNGKPRRTPAPQRRSAKAPHGACHVGHPRPKASRRDAKGHRICEACAEAKRVRERKHPEGYCRKGHEMTEENTYRSPRGGAQCRECRRASDRRRRHGKEF